jgi:hypothetical protein
MPTSYNFFKKEIQKFILDHIYKDTKILDVGPGCGTYSDMLKPYGYWMEGVEIFPPYVEQYNLTNKYDKIHIADITMMEIPYHIKFVIIGDVLEHLSVDDAKNVIQKLTDKNCDFLIAVPYMMEQGEHFGNIHETHLQPDLTPEIMLERYPELQLLMGNNQYGYYINKDFWIYEKAFVLYTTDSYFDLAEVCVNSIRKHSNTPIIIYNINSEKRIYGKGICNVDWDCDVHIANGRNEFIDRSDPNIYTLLIERPNIVKNALRLAKTVAYIDTDSVATKYCERIFDFFPEKSEHPYFVKGIYDFLMINGRGGASSHGNLSGTLEAPVCKLLGFNQYNRKEYRQTGYFVAGQNCIKFLEDWYWYCQCPTILRDNFHYAPFHEETVVNAMLFDKNIHIGLPYIYINGLHEYLDFKGQEYFIRDWVRVPQDEEHLLFYHGEKNIEKLNQFIEKL